MNRLLKRPRTGPLVVALLAFALSPVSAQDGDIDKALEAVTRENKELAASQKKMQEITEETGNLLEQYRAAQKRIEALGVYNGQLGTLLASQQGELDSLREQIDRVTDVSRQITPLMLKMIDSLEQFVSLDLPFLIDERKERIQGLRTLMNRSDVEDSEKFRRLMEAYQIENEYGRTIEAYRGSVNVNGKDTAVDFLRVGRISLIYQALGGEKAGVWDQKAKKWLPLSREDIASLPGAIRIARKQAAPSLVRIPVPAPEAIK